MKKAITLSLFCLINNFYSQTIITFAGGGQGDGLPAINQSIEPHNVFNDSINNIYFNSTNNGNMFTSVRRVDAGTGIISTLAGTNSSLIPGITGNASIAYIDHANMYVCHDNYLKKINLNNNAITIIAGNGTQGYTGDGGLATNASITMFLYNRMCIDAAGNIYMSDDANNCIRKIDASTQIISTFLNQTNAPFLDMPFGLCLDASGNLYIGNYDSHVVLKANTTTSVTTIFAGLLNTQGSTGDGGLATNAKLNHPYDLKFDGSGNLYICDDANDCIRKVDASGFISSFINIGLDGPRGFCFDGLGNTYISNNILKRIVKRNSAGALSGIAGNPFANFSGDGSLATNATIWNPGKLAKDAVGSIYFIDQGLSHLGLRVRKVNSSGIISTVAGYGSSGFSGDGGQAVNAQFNQISDICVDQTGYLYLADGNNKRIRKVDLSTGIVTTYAGDGTATVSGNGGAATSAGIGTPKAIATDAAGNLYISNGTSTIRVVNSSTGIITAFAGGGGSLGDGGLAINANVGAIAMCFDSQGDMIIADNINSRIRKITMSSGVINTIAGDGTTFTTNYGNGVNPISPIPIGPMSSLCIDANDNIYMGTQVLILKLNANNTLLSGIAEGSGTIADGVPVQQATCNPYGIINDNNGNILFSDNYRVYKITTNCPTTPTVTLGNNITQCNGQATITASSTNAIYYYWAWPGSSSSNSVSVNTSGNYIATVTDNNGCSASDTVSVLISQCVWPGDVNNDQTVDATDLLPIGIYYSTLNGIVRPAASNNWVGQPCSNWSQTQLNGANMKYADCNGDGQINFADTAAIQLNSGLSHPAKSIPNYIATNPTGYFTFNKSSYNPGDTVKATFNLGSSFNNLFNFYGSSFNVTYDVTNVKPNSESFSFLNSSWIGTINNNSISYSKINAGVVNASIVRINHTNVNGFGSIAKFNFVLNNTLTDTKLYLNTQNGIIINNSGTPYSFSTNIDSIALVPGTVTGIKNYDENSINIYPNPSNGSVTIEPQQENKQLAVYNVLGEKIYECSLSNVPININIKSSGVYLFSVSTNKGIITKRIIIEK
ncbi:MAG: T9SS type A sorting domain-containing protein [Bacteroidota bacterium]